jgi:hypothetical protein
MYKTLILFAVLLPSVLFAQDVDWFDKSKNEFSLSTSAELEGLAFVVNQGYDDFSGKTINLSGDITLSGDWTPIKEFNGIFDGNGHSISGLSEAGLFGSVVEGQIKNLTVRASKIKGTDRVGVLAVSFSGSIENVIVTADTVDGGAYTGGLVGYSSGGTITISNSHFTGNITGSGYGGGGLVGYSYGGTITILNSHFTGNITANRGGGLVGVSEYGGTITILNSHFTGNITASAGGGLVGVSEYGVTITISNSYSTGNITANRKNGSGGGLVGSGLTITISNSYSTGNITVTDNINGNGGGLVGFGGGLNITNSYASGTAPNGIAGNVPSSAEKTFIGVYYNSEGASSAVNGTIAPGVKALSQEDLKKKASFADWDFVDIWDIEEGSATPFLRPQSDNTPIISNKIARNPANTLTATQNSINLQAQNSARLDIYNIKGKLEKTLHFKSGVYTISLGHLPKGMYIAKISFGNEKKILKVPVY